MLSKYPADSVTDLRIWECLVSWLPKDRGKGGGRERLSCPAGEKGPQQRSGRPPSPETSSLHQRREKWVTACIVNSQHPNVPPTCRRKLLGLASCLPEMTGLGDGICRASGSLVMSHLESFFRHVGGLARRSLRGKPHWNSSPACFEIGNSRFRVFLEPTLKS